MTESEVQRLTTKVQQALEKEEYGEAEKLQRRAVGLLEEASAEPARVANDANDAVDGTVSLVCAPASPVALPLGYTTINCTAMDRLHNRSSASFQVNVFDGKPVMPELPDQTLNAASANYTWGLFGIKPAMDAIDGPVPVNCVPSQWGAPYQIGTMTVNCTVRDTAPVMPSLPNIVAEATGPAGAIVAYSVPPARDAADGSIPLTCIPASGGQFALGAKTVTCSATDRASNTVTGSFTITVRDATPPLLPSLPNLTYEATSKNGATVTFSANATDLVDGSLPISCVPQSGSVFPVATTHVTCSARDKAGNTGSGSFNVVVRDTTPPSVSTVIPSPTVLWPVNHKMVAVSLQDSTGDNTAVSGCVVKVKSNEPVSGSDSGNTSSDWTVASSTSVLLRAERSGQGEGRAYTLTVSCTDLYGNVGTSTGTVTVPKSMGGGTKQ